MRTLLPNSNPDVMPPSGNPTGSLVAASYTTQFSATADNVVAPFSIGSTGESGPYDVSLFIEISNSTVTAGNIDPILMAPGYAVPITFTRTLTADGIQASIAQVALAAGSATLEWIISGFGVGSCDVKIIASVVKLF